MEFMILPKYICNTAAANTNDSAIKKIIAAPFVIVAITTIKAQELIEDVLVVLDGGTFNHNDEERPTIHGRTYRQHRSSIRRNHRSQILRNQKPQRRYQSSTRIAKP
jgi:hypothetical protein